MKILRNVDIAPFTTFGIHATVAALAVYFDDADLGIIISDRSLPRPLLPLGGGSNMLFTRNFKGTVIINGISEIQRTPEYGHGMFRAGAGARLDDLCARTIDCGFFAMAPLSGIPGTLGGAIVQNAGAYGTEMADIVYAVVVYDRNTRKRKVLYADDLHFGYRTSVFKDPAFAKRHFIMDAYLNMMCGCGELDEYPALHSLMKSKCDDDIIPAEIIRESVLELRASKLPDPETTGSAGSFFMNPVVSKEEYLRLKVENPGVDIPHHILDDDESIKIPAAWLIDSVGMKGQRIGGAAVWDKQPLVIVNADGNATAADVLALETEIRSRVQDRFGITLVSEVIHIP